MCVDFKRHNKHIEACIYVCVLPFQFFKRKMGFLKGTGNYGGDQFERCLELK